MAIPKRIAKPASKACSRAPRPEKPAFCLLGSEVNLVVCNVKIAGTGFFVRAQPKPRYADPTQDASSKRASWSLSLAGVRTQNQNFQTPAHAALVVSNGASNLIELPGEGFLARKPRCARIAFSVCIVPGLNVAGKIQLNLTFLQLSS